MTKYSFLMLIFSSVNLSAEEAPWKSYSSAIKCKNEFLHFLESNPLHKEDYREVIGSRYDETVYRTIAHEIGNWSEVHLLENKVPFVYKIDDEKILKHTFSETCSLVTESAEWPDHFKKNFSKSMPEDWSNVDLKKLVDQKKKGLIYSWSPKFTYSVLILPKMESLAREMGYEFISVVDPRAKREEILQSLKALPRTMMNKFRNPASKKNFNRNVSSDLFMRAAFDHYPVTFVYNNGKIHSRFVTGVMTDNGLKKIVNIYASEL